MARMPGEATEVRAWSLGCKIKILSCWLGFDGIEAFLYYSLIGQLTRRYADRSVLIGYFYAEPDGKAPPPLLPTSAVRQTEPCCS